MNRFTAALTAGLVSALLSGVPALAVEIETARGPMDVDPMPARIVVLDLAALDSLDALGVPVADSVDTIYLDRLKHYQGAAGTLFEPDFESIDALRADLVIAGGHSASQVDMLAAMTSTIDMTITSGEAGPGNSAIDIGKRRIAAYGTLFGKQAEAAALIADIDAAALAAQTAAQGKGTVLIVQTNGPKISVYGTDSRYGWLHVALGLPQAVDNITLASHGDAVPFEFLREANPDWLIVVDRAAAIGDRAQRAAATLDNPLVRGTTAWTRGQVIWLDSSEIYLADGGYTSLMRTLGLLAEGFSGTSG